MDGLRKTVVQASLNDNEEEVKVEEKEVEEKEKVVEGGEKDKDKEKETGMTPSRASIGDFFKININTDVAHVTATSVKTHITRLRKFLADADAAATTAAAAAVVVSPSANK